MATKYAVSSGQSAFLAGNRDISTATERRLLQPQSQRFTATAEPAVGKREITGSDTVAGPGEYPWISLIAGDNAAAAHKLKKFSGLSISVLNTAVH